MRTNGFKVFSLLMVMVLLAVTAGSASTQIGGIENPSTSPYPPGYHPPVPATISQMQAARANPSGGAADGGAVWAQAAYTGKPGTIFPYVRTFGESEVAYFEDSAHVNRPTGMAFSDGGELYVAEESGARLIKYGTYADWNLGHTPVWTVGVAGMHDWGTTGLNYPRDVAVAPDGGSVWVADSDIISQFDAATGDLIQHFPPEPWNVPDDNLRFFDARGLAFDSQGFMYISDMNRKRIQIFSFDLDGVPVYETTMELFNNPSQIAFDAEDTLYVTDVFDFHVKACAPDKSGGWPWTWNCDTFYGIPGEQGDSGDGQHLNMAFGLGYNLDHDLLYIADGGSGKLLRCTTGDTPACSAIVTDLGWPSDVEVDPTDGTLTLTDGSWNAILRFFGEDDLPPDKFTGDPRSPWLSNYPDRAPYLTDAMHFNSPFGVEVDGSGNVYILEENGQRLSKLDKNGSVIWQLGEAGVNDQDVNHFEYPKAVAVDKRNLVIVGGGGGNVRIYNGLTGLHAATLDQGGGDGLFNFWDVQGVATDSANLIYVSDSGRNRVMVYSYTPTATPQFKFIRQVGMGEHCSNRNDSFCNPRGIFVDAAKNLYVADHDNCRVQKFNSKGLYVKTFGTGMCRDSFGSLGGPADVAVDAQGRVYVVEEWNGRVQVFDKAGAYLATIAGGWGSNTGELRNPRSVAVDKTGNVYVADTVNSRVQKYAPSLPYWTQININGFGNRRAPTIGSLATFKGSLFAGGTNEYNQAAIWKRVGTNWTPVVTDGFEDGANGLIDHMLEFKGYLYATTVNCKNEDCSFSNGGEMWRSADGLSWQVVAQNGFGNQNNAELFRLAVLNGKLCVSTWTYGADGSELWCSATGEIGTWERDVEDGFGVSGNKVILSMVDYKPPLPNTVTYSYASTLNVNGTAHLWRKAAGGTSWQPLWNIWPDDGRYFAASGLTVYKNYLYVIARTQHVDELPDAGATIYRCQKCDGSDWVEVLPEAMQDPNSFRGYALEATPGGLYAFFGNGQEGVDILFSKDGLTWTRPFPKGLGNSNIRFTYWDNAVLWWGNALYLGVFDYTNGASVWKHCPTAKTCK